MGQFGIFEFGSIYRFRIGWAINGGSQIKREKAVELREREREREIVHFGERETSVQRERKELYFSYVFYCLFFSKSSVEREKPPVCFLKSGPAHYVTVTTHLYV